MLVEALRAYQRLLVLLLVRLGLARLTWLTRNERWTLVLVSLLYLPVDDLRDHEHDSVVG